MSRISIFITSIFLLGTLSCSNEVSRTLSFDYSNLEVPIKEVEKGTWGSARAEVVHENKSYLGGDSEESIWNFDFYRPHGVDKELPLIVFIHSGAFITGNKKNFIITQYCKDLVRTGEFAAAIIDYRLINYNNAGALISKCYTRTKLIQSVGDARNAISHFIANAEEYTIDPEQIFVLGYSAGAIISNQIVFTDLNEADEYIDATGLNSLMRSSASALGFESAFEIDNKEAFANDIRNNIKGVVSISGAVMSHHMLDDMDNIHTPILLIHGSDDRIVPMGNESPFSKYADNDFDIYVPNVTRTSSLDLVRKFTVKKEVIEGIVDFVSSPICGSKCIYDGVYADSKINYIEIENGPHMFMIGENGLVNETYLKTRTEIYNFLKRNLD